MARSGVENPGCSLFLTLGAWVRYDFSATDPGPRTVTHLECNPVFCSELALVACHLGPCGSPGLSELRKVPSLHSTHSRISRLSPSSLHPCHLKVFSALEILRPDHSTEQWAWRVGSIWAQARSHTQYWPFLRAGLGVRQNCSSSGSGWPPGGPWPGTVVSGMAWPGSTFRKVSVSPARPLRGLAVSTWTSCLPVLLRLRR